MEPLWKGNCAGFVGMIAGLLETLAVSLRGLMSQVLVFGAFGFLV